MLNTSVDALVDHRWFVEECLLNGHASQLSKRPMMEQFEQLRVEAESIYKTLVAGEQVDKFLKPIDFSLPHTFADYLRWRETSIGALPNLPHLVAYDMQIGIGWANGLESRGRKHDLTPKAFEDYMDKLKHFLERGIEPLESVLRHADKPMRIASGDEAAMRSLLHDQEIRETKAWQALIEKKDWQEMAEHQHLRDATGMQQFAVSAVGYLTQYLDEVGTLTGNAFEEQRYALREALEAAAPQGLLDCIYDIHKAAGDVLGKQRTIERPKKITPQHVLDLVNKYRGEAGDMRMVLGSHLTNQLCLADGALQESFRNVIAQEYDRKLRAFEDYVKGDVTDRLTAADINWTYVHDELKKGNQGALTPRHKEIAFCAAKNWYVSNEYSAITKRLRAIGTTDPQFEAKKKELFKQLDINIQTDQEWDNRYPFWVLSQLDPNAPTFEPAQLLGISDERVKELDKGYDFTLEEHTNGFYFPPVSFSEESVPESKPTEVQIPRLTWADYVALAAVVAYDAVTEGPKILWEGVKMAPQAIMDTLKGTATACAVTHGLSTLVAQEAYTVLHDAKMIARQKRISTPEDHDEQWLESWHQRDHPQFMVDYLKKAITAREKSYGNELTPEWHAQLKQAAQYNPLLSKGNGKHL